MIATVRNHEYHSQYIASNVLIYDGDSSAFYMKALQEMGKMSSEKYRNLKFEKTNALKSLHNSLMPYQIILRLFGHLTP